MIGSANMCAIKNVFFILFILFNPAIIEASKLLGPYTTSITNLTTCADVPPDEVNISVTWTKPNGKDRIIVDAHVPKTIGPFAGGVSVRKLVKNEYVEAINMNFNNLCDTFLANAGYSFWPKLDGRCYLLKGHQHFNVTDTDRTAHIFSGKYMPYGKYMTRIYMKYGRHLLGCRDIYSDIMPA